MSPVLGSHFTKIYKLVAEVEVNQSHSWRILHILSSWFFMWYPSNMLIKTKFKLFMLFTAFMFIVLFIAMMLFAGEVSYTFNSLFSLWTVLPYYIRISSLVYIFKKGYYIVSSVTLKPLLIKMHLRLPRSSDPHRF